MRDRLQPLRVAITGGTAGLGLGPGARLLDRGARVAFVARHRAGRRADHARLPHRHGIVGDVSRKEDIHPIAIQILGALGGLDVLVNNASSLGPVPLRPLADTACEDLELALATNLARPLSPDEGAARLPGCHRSRRRTPARRQHFKRRRGDSLRDLGRLWGEQGCAACI